MINIYPILLEIKEELKKIEGIKSLRIGLEKGADSSFNCPLIRIVSERNEAKGLRESFTFQIVIAFDNKNDMEERYEQFYNMEHQVKNLLMKMPYEIFFLNTINDEDRLSALKAGLMRFKIENLVDIDDYN